ncbi:MocR-like pyridoxine biosynthesis transcription factor PdxR [Cupriavidus pauculus]|uniref:DNA-binding protein n=1 Tax=Cupriavidus pauculus TaxID=82633 RepID=A0A2N5C5U5_9BURK|nr:PLP-dependent aminotransferase family protein [Cupriavidus pauculus]PLP97592.1 DNA-binding protein [Cupriavidus pauculus]
MNVHLTLEGRHGLAGQIYRQLRAGVLEGRLAPGERLPSTRELATRLGVSRKTTLDVFERLIAEGYLRTRTGDGTFVADEMTRLAPAPAATQMPALQPSNPVWDQLPEASAPVRTAPPPAYDFASGATDKTLFPFDQWRRCIHHALRVQARGRSPYHDPAGEQDLRLAISRYLAVSRAVVGNWQDVVVTQGAQQAINLLGRAALRPGDVVAMEDPGYPRARAIFAALGARVVSVPVDADGLIVDALPDHVRAVYVTPAHQFPLGMPMTLERRLALLDWAQRHGALVIEDDYDGEFRFEGRPMESLKGLDNADVVAYVGTFSKTIFPELRVGYVIPPRPLAGALCKAKQVVDWHSCTMTQTALAKFMHDGYFGKHLRRMHKEYAARRAALLDGLQRHLAGRLTPLPSAAGLHVAAWLAHGEGQHAALHERDFVARAAQAGVGVSGLSDMYGARPARPGIVLGYGGMGVDGIQAGIARLAAAL